MFSQLGLRTRNNVYWVLIVMFLYFVAVSVSHASDQTNSTIDALSGVKACVIPPQEPVTIVAEGLEGAEDIVPSQGDYPPGFFVSNYDSLNIYHISPDGQEASVFSEGTVNPTTLAFVPDEFTGNGVRMMFISHFGEDSLWEVAPDGTQHLVHQFPVSQPKAITYIPQDFGGPASGKLLYTELSHGNIVDCTSGMIFSIDSNGNNEQFIPHLGFIGWSITPAPDHFGVYTDYLFTSQATCANRQAKIVAIDPRSKQTIKFADIPLQEYQEGLRHVVFSPTGWAISISPEFRNESVLLVSINPREISMFDHRGRLVSTFSHAAFTFSPRGIAFIKDDIIFSDFWRGRILRANISTFSPVDCDNNGLGDICEIDSGLADDCNENGILDRCEITGNASLDCNNNNILDYCDVRDGYFQNPNGNSYPEICETTIYVDQHATGANNGSTWDNAYQNLQMGLSHAITINENPIQIWVADGTYTPAPPKGDRTISFELLNNVALYGGFAGGEKLFRLRNPSVNKSILSGDLNQDDNNGGDNSENSYHVVISANNDSSTILDGFIISGGNADSSNLSSNKISAGLGGGLHITKGSPIITDCFFDNNFGLLGGAVYIGNSSSADIIKCLFDNNSALNGGALYGEFGHVRLIECVLRKNNAEKGGVLYSDAYCLIQLQHCMIYENSSGYGGIYNNGGEVILDNCIIRNNYSANRGSGLTSSVGYTMIKNCLITNNQSEAIVSAAIYNGERSLTEIQQSIIWKNIADTEDVESAQITNDGRMIIEHSTVEGWSGKFGGPGNTGDDPIFRDPFGPDGEMGTGDEDLRLSPGSPAINTGIPYYKAFLDETDLDGHARVLCDTVDRGAYEFGIGDINCNQTVDLLDYLFWDYCFTGPGEPSIEWDCTPFDFDGDQDVDLYDAAQFMNILDQN